MIGAEQHLPYDRPPLSKDFIFGSKTFDQIQLASESMLRDLDVRLRLGCRAVSLDLSRREIASADGDLFGFDALVIATGAEPRVMPGSEHLGGIYVLRSVDHAAKLRAAIAEKGRIVVVGGGFIGAELAAGLAQQGTDFTLVEPEATLMHRSLGAELGRIMTSFHRSKGVKILTKTAVAGFEGSDHVRAVHLSDGRILAADIVILAIGCVVTTQWLSSSGLPIDNGVVCDEFLSVKGTEQIYAVGDVARWHHPVYKRSIRVEHWTNATEQASIVAANLCGERIQASQLPYVWSDQFGLRLQISGFIDNDGRLEITKLDDEGRFVAIASSADRLDAVVAFGSPRHFIALRKMLAEGRPLREASLYLQQVKPRA